LKSLLSSLKSIIPAIALAVLFSCSNKDHEPEPNTGSCKYAGLSYVVETRYYGSKTTGTYDKNIIQTDDRLPLKISTVIRTIENDTVQNTLVKDDAENDELQYKYDAEGFLVQEAFTQNRNQQGGESTRFFFLDKGPVGKLLTDLVRTTDFKYENGWLKEVNMTSVITYLGDNLPAATQTFTTKTKYNYDAQNNLVSTDAINQDNFKTLTNYVGGLITSMQSTAPDGTISTATYKNENGKNSQIVGVDVVTNYKYDTNGNLLKYETVYKGKTNATQEFQYDNKINPETLVPTKFKGMPLPFGTVQSMVGMGINNVTRLKNTTYGNDTSFVWQEDTKFTYTNGNLPQSSVSTVDTQGGKFIRRTTYKYADCQQ
jgi:YD repeat-containing protein